MSVYVYQHYAALNKITLYPYSFSTTKAMVLFPARPGQSKLMFSKLLRTEINWPDAYLTPATCSITPIWNKT